MAKDTRTEIGDNALQDTEAHLTVTGDDRLQKIARCVQPTRLQVEEKVGKKT
jgi:hypothetical protein